MTTRDAVREQYEALPYPPRDPAHELRELRTTLVGELKLARTIFWGGVIPSPFRALDAGCGTGDSAIFMAEQLRETGGAVVGVDLSEASLAIATARAEKRGLSNVTFLRARIEDLPGMGMEPFDYIVSAGVLHHLPDPDAGLRTLRSILTPGGGLGLMVYARYGRTAIYQLQELFRQIAPECLPVDERLRVVKHTLNGLSDQHWAKLGASTFSAEVKLHGDAGLFDLFLHAQDRAYSVPELHDWLDGAGLRLLRFDMPVVYEPEANLPGVNVASFESRQRQAVAELLNGRMKKHTFFATPIENEPPAGPRWDDETALPSWLVHDPSRFLEQVERRPQLNLFYEGTEFQCSLDGFRRHFLRLADGQRTLGQVLDGVALKMPAHARSELLGRWGALHQALSIFNVFGLLRPGE